MAPTRELATQIYNVISQISKFCNINIELLMGGTPVNEDKKKLENGMKIIDLVIVSNLLASKSEVRRIINNKGIKINNQTI